MITIDSKDYQTNKSCKCTQRQCTWNIDYLPNFLIPTILNSFADSPNANFCHSQQCTHVKYNFNLSLINGQVFIHCLCLYIMPIMNGANSVHACSMDTKTTQSTFT